MLYLWNTKLVYLWHFLSCEWSSLFFEGEIWCGYLEPWLSYLLGYPSPISDSLGLSPGSAANFQLPFKWILWEASGYGCGSCVLAIHMGDVDWVPRFCLGPGSSSDVMGIWKLKQWVRELSFSFFSPTPFYINEIHTCKIKSKTAHSLHLPRL